MYNLPYQESEDPLDDINCCFGTGINCIDLYHLNIFPGTRMYKWMHEKELLSKYYSITRQNDFYQAYQQLINDSCINFCMSNTISQRQKGTFLSHVYFTFSRNIIWFGRFFSRCLDLYPKYKYDSGERNAKWEENLKLLL